MSSYEDTVLVSIGIPCKRSKIWRECSQAHLDAIQNTPLSTSELIGQQFL